MSSPARAWFVRTVAVSGALWITVACGGSPSISSRPDSVGASGGMPGSAGSGTGGSGATGGSGINVGGMAGENGDAGSSSDPCAVAEPPPECFENQPSGPGCGDGEINQDDEQCDDGNGLPGDGCSGVCQEEPYFECKEPGEPCELTIACGDGAVDPGEFCDDGNTDDGDGCSADCEMQDPSYVCPDPGEKCVLLYDCGDSRVNGSEECDDGNEDSDDGCTSTCKKEDGWLCRRPGMPCVLDQFCGDSIIQTSRGEDCDDGNAAFGDGCSGICTEEPYFDCEEPGEACVYQIICGDGTRDPGEPCDDGNDVDGDGCMAVLDPDSGVEKCVQDVAYICTSPGDPCTQLYACGDGRLHACSGPGCEACDDGDTEDGDGCDSDCLVEPGYICRRPGDDCVLDISCGDGIIQASAGEVCDDGNTDWDDGCYGDCTVAPYFNCPTAGAPCVSTIVCGDGKRDPGEACDDDDTDDGDGCNSDCAIETNYRCTGAVGGLSTCTKVIDCGDGKVSGSEECDDGPTRKVSGDGCSSTCQLETGYICPTPGGACVVKVECGDGKRAASEQCDDGDTMGGDGCSGQCKIENDWNCTGAVGAQSACTYSVVCGDGVLGGAEVCDDDNTTAGDGCAANCLSVETGYKCARAGLACVPICGDGIIKGTEQCDPTPANLTACNKCRLTTGYTCGASGLGPCVATTCGNGAAITDPPGSTAYVTKAKAAAEPGEGCDDGNAIAGDGCGPTCQLEPPVTVGPNPTVALTCGDGLKTGSEGCDDGNVTAGDGCSATCTVETGWACTESVTRPGTVAMAVTYRDFKSDAATGGHDHFQNVLSNDKGIAGTACTSATQATCGRLDSAGKPQKASGTFNSITPTSNNTTATARYATWFRDTNTLGYDVSVIRSSLLLNQVGGAASDVYEYASAAYFPLNGLGHGTTCGNEVTPGCCSGVCAGRNYGFTTELRYFFQYQGGETLTFRGDDDVWVFINGRLAVDVGGVHCAEAGRVVLGDSNSTCSVHGGDYITSGTDNCALTGDPPACTRSTGEIAEATDARFDITKGNVYEIVLFHAERLTQESNFRLTLQGFLAPRSTCSPVCGPNPSPQTGVTLTPPEECDDGAANVSTVEYGKCLSGTCTLGPYCGDAVTNGPEACDNGSNNAQYGQSGCGPGCVLPSRCGDGTIDSPLEECDLGSGNTTLGYEGCTTSCDIGPRCGDGIENGPETCDDGANDGSYEGCLANCTPAPRCGDGNTDTAFGEACDGGASCDTNCQLRCGNGDPDPGEECDDGINSGGYNRCGPGCLIGDYCGDGTRNGPEECDDGVNDGGYGECAPGCKFGPSCGDGIVNGTETCDDGLNDGFYNGCNADCTPGPSCGDGLEQPEWGELCDDALEPDSCQNCSPLGTCGDSITQDPPEECDDGVNDGGYGQCGPGCLQGPHCSDGVVQAPQEECDEGLGSGLNDGGYGECTAQCQLGPYCGDGVVTTPQEVCDDGINDEFYGSCTPDCQGFGPRCGDDTVQEEWGEECDDDDDPNCQNCRLGAQCGDKAVQSGEECDDGVNDGGYGQCGPSCKYGPRCGDGVVQRDDGEQCDNGEGMNTGAYGGCENTCRYAPHCGDGKVQSSFEQCDDGNNKNNDGCSSACKRETSVPK
jgi:fibro-slime domain-containing protein